MSAALLTTRPCHERILEHTASLFKFLKRQLRQKTEVACLIAAHRPVDAYMCDMQTFKLRNVEAGKLHPAAFHDIHHLRGRDGATRT